MATVDRPFGHIAAKEPNIEDGSACAGCEAPVPEDSGVECYCAAEDFGRAHELYKWCTQDCFNQTHEDCHPDPPEPDYDMAPWNPALGECK